MAKELKRVDISGDLALMRLVEEVRSTRESRLLEFHSEDVAILSPIKPGARSGAGKATSKADFEAFRSAAGSWRDVDIKGFLADVDESRRTSRQPVDL
ncbi:MAG: hypothetical protein ACRDHX_15235 [Chloroflexota bacterium]